MPSHNSMAKRAKWKRVDPADLGFVYTQETTAGQPGPSKPKNHIHVILECFASKQADVNRSIGVSLGEIMDYAPFLKEAPCSVRDALQFLVEQQVLSHKGDVWTWRTTDPLHRVMIRHLPESEKRELLQYFNISANQAK